MSSEVEATGFFSLSDVITARDLVIDTLVEATCENSVVVSGPPGILSKSFWILFLEMETHNGTSVTSYPHWLT